MGVNGKHKGNSFERKISNRLSAHFKPVTGIKNSFRRNPDSGSFWGATNQKRVNTHNLEYANFGDLLCPHNFCYSIECKHYKTSPSLQAIVTQSVKQWDQWLNQCEQDAQNASKIPALIVKYNNVDEMVFIKHQITGHQPVLIYKQYFIYSFDTFLTQKNTVFFTEDK